jgi:4-hydroxyphenylpyruvate dioxygenase
VRVCLNQSCFPGLPTARFLEIAAEAGADSCELRVIGNAEGARSIGAAASASGMPIDAVNSLMDWALPEDPDPMPRLDELVDVAARAGAPFIVCVVPIGSGAMPPHDEVIRRSIDRLAVLGERAASAGVGLALEQVGRSSTRPGARGAIRALSEARAVVEAAGAAGLVLDTYNLATAEVPFHEVAGLPAELIAVAQIADRASTDGQRTFPGDGDVDLGAFVAALASAGFDGSLSLELLPSECPQDAATFARRGAEALRSLVRAAGGER